MNIFVPKVEHMSCFAFVKLQQAEKSHLLLSEMCLISDKLVRIHLPVVYVCFLSFLSLLCYVLDEIPPVEFLLST